MKSCLDCKRCVVKIPVNKQNVYLTDLRVQTGSGSLKTLQIRQITCAAGMWGSATMTYDSRYRTIRGKNNSKKFQRISKSKYLMTANHCLYFPKFSMEE